MEKEENLSQASSQSREFEDNFKPVLRYMEIFPSNHQGQPVFLLKDPLGITEEIVVIPQHMGFILPLLDGNHTLRDIQAEASKRYQQIVPMEEIKRVIKFLDEKGLLFGDGFERVKENAYKKWLDLKVRPMAHAGFAYPLKKEEAREFVKDVLSLAKIEEPQEEKIPRILIAPHIDLKTGARGFAESYARFKISHGSRIILFGVGHFLDEPFSLLTKDMYTPFGIVKNDKGGAFFLINSKNLELYPDHIAHKLEHSIEFQTLFLNYYLEDGFVVLPFLVGPMDYVKEDKKIVDDLVDGIFELIDENTYIVAGIDYCHLGLRYGDPFPVSFEDKQNALKTDRELTHLALSGKFEEIEKRSEELKNFKICGYSTLYLLAKIVDKLKKEKGISPEEKIFYQDVLPFGQGSVVSIVSAGLYF